MNAYEVFANLSFWSEDGTISVVSNGNIIVATFPDRFPLGFRQSLMAVDFHRNEIAAVDSVLRQLNLVVHFVLAGKVIGILGSNLPPDVLSILLKLHPVRLRVIPLLSAFLQIKSAEIAQRNRFK